MPKRDISPISLNRQLRFTRVGSPEHDARVHHVVDTGYPDETYGKNGHRSGVAEPNPDELNGFAVSPIQVAPDRLTGYISNSDTLGHKAMTTPLLIGLDTI